MNPKDLSRLLEIIVAHIEIPPSLYQKAADRHRSLGEWLHRPESSVLQFAPDVRPQGSFRYGTVTRPLDEHEEYDLDNICVLTELGKQSLTQAQLKQLYGQEIKAYAKAHGMLAPVSEHNRCWRLTYADEVNFHLDTLPCVPEDNAVIQQLIAAGVPADLARCAIAITDRRHPQYNELTFAWFSSNPRGFARWFEQRAAIGRRRALLERSIKASVEDVPPYEWKTTLQMSIQLEKRHRDTMFRRNPELAPISMIITNLSAQAYDGETDLARALSHIVAAMPNYVRPDRPRVPNPTDPFEDYADKWGRDPRLEKSFWEWHLALQTDLARLARVLGTAGLSAEVERIFAVTLTQDELRSLDSAESQVPAPHIRKAPTLIIPSASKPWDEMSNCGRERFERWQVRELLDKYHELRLIPSANDIVLEGTLRFCVIGPDLRSLEDAYDVVLRLPERAPLQLPTAKETGGRIPPSYHKLQGDILCLGASTALRLTLTRSPSLLTFVESFVIPYLYGYSYFCRHGAMPYGELPHGDEGIREYLATLFHCRETRFAEVFLSLAGMKKRRANKHACPCTSGCRLGRCHNREVNAVRTLMGRLWCRDEYERVIRVLGLPVSSQQMRAYRFHHRRPATGRQSRRRRTLSVPVTGYVGG